MKGFLFDNQVDIGIFSNQLITMKHLSILVFTILFSFSISAQQSKIDSLQIEFNKSKIDSVKAKILAEIGVAAYYVNLEVAKKHNDTLIDFSKSRSKKYLAQGYRMRGTFYLLEADFENSLKNYEISLDILKRIGKYKNVADVYSNIATLYGRKNNPDKAIEYYKKAITLNDSIGNLKGNFNSYLNLAITYRGSNNYFKISQTLIKALEIAEKYNLENKSHVHNELATNYAQLESYEKADYHVHKALKLAKEKNNTMALMHSYQGLGYIYENRDNDYKKAAESYEKSLVYSLQMNDKSSIVLCLYSAGFYYLHLNKKLKSIEYLKRGLKISKKIKNNYQIIRGNYQLANFHAYQGNQKKAEFYIQEANKLIGKGSKKSFVEFYLELAKSFKKSGNYKNAYKNMNLHVVLKDSINKLNGIQKIAELETKYQTEKKEKENLQLKADNTEQALLTQKENTQKWLFALGLLFVTITALFIWWRYKSEAKAKQIISKQKDDIIEQKNIIENLQKELHHRIKNNLAIIDTFIEVAKEEFNDKKFDTKLTEIQNRILSINEIHKQLYQSTDVTNLNIKNYIDILSKNVAESFTDKDISIQKNVEDISLNANTSFPVGLIINEFLTNSYKYAFDNKGTINIQMKDQGKNYLLTLSDNGIGLPSDFDIEQIETFGLRFVKLLAKQLDGVFKLESKNGVQLTIHIPKV